MNPSPLFSAVVALALPLVVSCGGSAPAATTPSDSTATDGGAAALPTSDTATATATTPAASNVAWKDMDHQQRLDFMAHVVMPQMKKEFAEFDANRFGNINCHTCHGPGAKDGTFKMPNPEIMPIPTTEAGFKDVLAKQPDISKFMMSKVVPDMAKLLGEPAYDPKTQKGFGCHDCHTAGK